MEPTPNEPSDRSLEDRSAIKDRLGQLGRSLKNVDLQSRIVARPFAAVGIAAAAGALIALIRPTRNRDEDVDEAATKGVVAGLVGAIGMRLVRELAVQQIKKYASNYARNRRDEQYHPSDAGAQSPGGVRYTPAL